MLLGDDEMPGAALGVEKRVIRSEFTISGNYATPWSGSGCCQRHGISFQGASSHEDGVGLISDFMQAFQIPF